MKFELTSNQAQLLNNILSYDCSYLEDCTEEEFQLYQNLRASLDNTLFEHNIKVAKAQEKQPKAEW